MAITKKQIKKEIRDLKTLGKSRRICIIDYELREMLTIKMAQKYLRLIDKCMERKLADYQIEYLQELKKDIKIHMKGEDEIYSTEEAELNAVMSCGYTIIEVMVLQP